MTRLLRSCLLVFSLLAAGFSAQAQSQNCRITLSELIAPAACLCGNYSVDFTVATPLPNPYRLDICPTVSATDLTADCNNTVASLTQTLTADVNGVYHMTITIPCTLDTSRFYYVRVTNVATNCQSNIKAITVRPVDRSPKPFARIKITNPVLDTAKPYYCPKDTLTFAIDSLVIVNNRPPATFQWFKNGSTLDGQTGDHLRIGGLKRGDCIFLLVTKGNICALNDTAASNTVCPIIKADPRVAILTDSGSGCSDSVTVLRLDTANIGRGGYFKWFKNGQIIPGITGIRFVLQPGFANCRDSITAKAYTVDCPDSVKAAAFIIKSCGRVRIDTVVPTAFCAGDTVRVTYSTLNCFDVGNVFTFQFSDSAGSFASPIDAGSVVDTTGGVAQVLVPATLPGGHNYRLRMTTTMPMGISINSFGPLTIFPRPADVTSAALNRRCGPGPVTVTVTSAGAVSFRWYTAAIGGTRVTRPDGSLVTTDTFTVQLVRDTTFYVEAVNANGCVTATRTPIIVLIGQPLDVQPGPDQTVCQGGPCVQLIGGSPTGGVWSGIGVVGSAFCPDTLAIGAYTVQYLLIDRFFGCKDSATKQITIRGVLKPDAGTADSTVCVPGPPVSFQLHGFTPDTGSFTWSSPSTPGVVTSIGVVTVAALDTTGPNILLLTYTTADGACSRSDTRILRTSGGPRTTLTVSPPLLCNTPTGTVLLNQFDNTWTVVFDSAGAPFTPGIASVPPLYVGFAAGSYGVSISAGACVRHIGFVVSDLLGPQVAINGLAAAYCSSDSCVQLGTTPAAGGGIVHFSSNPPGAVSDSGLFCPSLSVPGTVQIFVTYRDTLTGCLGADTVTTIVNLIPGANAEPDTTLCLNAGILPLSGGGTWTGSPAIVPLGSGQGFNPTLGVLVPDSNVLTKTVTSANCSTTIRKVIRVLPSPQPVLSQTGTVTLCNNGSLAVTVTIAGIPTPLPIAGITVELKNLTTGVGVFNDSGRFTIDSAGVYRAYAFGSSCQDSGTATLTVVTDPIGPVNFAPDTSVCRNAVFTLHGTPPSGAGITAVYKLNGVILPNGVFDANTIPAATTQVSVFYVVSNGTCTDSARKLITLVDAPTATLTAPNTTSCANAIQLTAGPTGLGLHYVFFRNGTIVSVPDSTTAPVYTATVSGVYTVLAIAGTCSDLSDPLTIQISTPPVLPTITNVINCAGSASISLATPDSATTTSYSWFEIQPYTHPNPVVAIGPGGPYVFNTSLAGAGTHLLRLVVNNGNCKDSTTMSIVLGLAPTFSLVLDSASDCLSANGHARIVYIGTDTANWVIQQETGICPGILVGHNINNLCQGDHTVTVTNTVTGCSQTTPFTIVAPGTFRARIRGVAAGYCIEDLPVVLPKAQPDSGTFTLYEVGTPPIAIPLPGPIIPNLPGGSYFLAYSVDSNHCQGHDTAHFAVNSPQTPTITPTPRATVCQGTTVTLRATLNGPSSVGRGYQWLFNGNTIPGQVADSIVVVDAGPYSVRVDSAGCSRFSGFYIVTVQPAPIGNVAIVGRNPACAGDTLTLVSNLAAHYTWLLNGTPTGDTLQQIRITQSGGYSVTVSNGICSTTSPVQTATFNPLPAVNAGPDGQACVSTPSIVLQGFTPALSDSVRFLEQYVTDNLFHPNIAGVGTKQVTLIATQNGCTAFDTAYYTIVPGFNVTVDPTAKTICHNTTTPLTASITPVTSGAHYSFQWFNNGIAIPGATDSIFQADTVGSYTVLARVISADSCSALSVPTPVDEFPFTAPNAGRDTIVCVNTPAFTLSGTPAGGVWSAKAGSGGIEPSGRFTPASAVVGVNTIYFTTAQGACTLVDSVLITVNRVPVVAATYFNLITGKDNDPIDILDSVELRATGADTYVWGPANAGLTATTGSPVIAKPRLTQEYVVVGTTQGCVASATVTVVVHTDVRVANGFSPNTDGENDFWNIYNIQNYPKADIRVYNRWGALVFKTTGDKMQTFDDYWDGTSEGKDVPVGTYYYTIDLNNNQKPFIGSVTVVR